MIKYSPNPSFSKKTSRLGVIFVTLSCFLADIVNASVPSGIENSSESQKSAELFRPEKALLDPENRISDEFSIPEKLKNRTAFWFDIYTKYGSQEHVIHHVTYPWIIYKVVDTSSILNTSENRWVKYHKAENLVKRERLAVKNSLRRLARRKHYKGLVGLDKEVYKALARVKGSRRRVFKEAEQNLRVQLGQKDFLKSGLISSQKYLPFIEREFTANGLPTELTRLPFVESSFNVKAQSKVGASGIWQIMPATGKSYLLITDHIDERNSPFKASLAAIEILKRNYRSLNSWPLAITAYNHGPTGVHRALRKAKVTELSDLVHKYSEGSFGFASANFYTSFLAALHAEKYSKELFPEENNNEETLPLDHHIITVKRPLRVRELMKETGLDIERLLEYNLDLKNAVKKNVHLPPGYKVLLPIDTRLKTSS